MSTKATQATAHSGSIGLGRALGAGLLGGAIAGVVNTVLLYVGQAVNGGPLMMTTPGSAGPEGLDLFMVLFLSFGPGLAAGIAFWALARNTARPTRWLLVLAAVVFAAFFFGPFNAASGVVAIVILELMHIGAAAPILWSVLRLRPAA
jgi:hypothetical protein